MNFVENRCRDLKSGGTGDDNATPVPRCYGGGGAVSLQKASSCAGHIGRTLPPVKVAGDKKKAAKQRPFHSVGRRRN